LASSPVIILLPLQRQHVAGSTRVRLECTLSAALLRASLVIASSSDFSIEGPLRDGVREAVADCIMAGVRVTMCTGDNELTARSIAQQCSIYTTGGIIMEGPHFRTLSPDVIRNIAPRLRVLTQSSPEDNR